MKGYWWGIGSVVLVTVAQLILKWGMMNTPLMSLADINGQFVFNHLPQFIAVICGLAGYALSMLCWFFALRYLPLNRAYPLLSLSYALVYLGAVSLPWFSESATLLKTLGAGFILLGIWLINTKPIEKD
ncbi:4-amino-4-deoxy-L-arabinose-phosphoundecaprenol flippase subunit ArnF [Yersinia enterocolitica]|uniref:Probable 4-amino-4-deoxy-L-arabinose-phosphoundecaprenol flippase subunit ArnF n=1 Tax=Yersinia enterocolitica TaxID=630 RepID=A0AAD2Z7B0_YEREN|nr:4-amino-4-deoxy-L-arabinose-phosphoundecaprenol flippase subunit ArnF [Yersinia enterocolitica]EKN3338990.1 4-amino-4-deoxy-L-arabinose-phosphoundecaprenol flippase subunit ArnF [Yersinia enterocolitica]EKN3401279.1 4-amino-4-deoxy-L-arabinose-phosphoundecaprenol flippase subunit ArnF [Yersinia enterocolitica]EKN3440549.1 4-amino-4-deoxy-L-arabinose-phosphoundecaprenol flippase subunit ArnF [Yersinia enterocolitica]EKN3487296.1 4-amino-4-deoxy-L-arabinose-phosphoundecaprenol flippase subunit